jgi:hypothetical protein
MPCSPQRFGSKLSPIGVEYSDFRGKPIDCGPPQTAKRFAYRVTQTNVVTLGKRRHQRV